MIPPVKNDIITIIATVAIGFHGPCRKYAGTKSKKPEKDPFGTSTQGLLRSKKSLKDKPSAVSDIFSGEGFLVPSSASRVPVSEEDAEEFK